MRTRRVLMVACAFPPAGGSGVQRSVKFAKYLPQFGWLPTVWTVDPPYGGDQLPRDPTLLSDLPPEVTIRAQQCDRKFRRAVSALGGVCAAIGAQRLASGLARVLDGGFDAWLERRALPDAYASWARASVGPLCDFVKEGRIEVIYSTFSPASNHLLGLTLKRRTGLPWVADFRDLWTEDDRYCETSRKRRSAHRRLEQEVLESADVVVGVTERQTAILAGHVPAVRHKFVTITNGFDPTDFAVDGPESRFHRPGRESGAFYEDGRFVLAHVGRFYRWRASDAFFAGLRRFVATLGKSQERFVFRIVGHANEATRAKIRATGVAFDFTGYVSHDDAVREMQSADALLLSVPQGPNAESVIPGKVFEYLAAQKPILVVGPDGGECEAIVRSCKAGIAVGFDERAIADALGDLYGAWRDGATPDRPADRPSNKLERYSRVALTRKLASIFDSLVGAEVVDCGLECVKRRPRVDDPQSALNDNTEVFAR